MIPSRLEQILDPGAPPAELAALFSEHGFPLYLVGGSVRDLILDVAHADLDFATAAPPQQIKQIVADWADDIFTAGERFGTVGVIKKGRVLEVTTFRSEVYRDESRNPTVEYADSVEVDLSRRDFTINALALELPEPRMVDPFGGLEDIGKGILRTPLSPEVSFGDDPLRMLRLYRFVSVLGFRPIAEVAAAASAMASRLGIISKERIRDELSKLLGGAHVAAGLWGLHESGLAREFIPEFSALALEQDPLHRHKDVLAHTIAVVEKSPRDLVMRLAALCHDIGKPATRGVVDGKVAFHHHEVVGSRLTKNRLKELRYPKQVVEDVTRLVYLHMRPHTFALGWTDRAVRRYVRDAGPLLEELNDLVRCDVTTGNAKRARQISRRIDELEERILELRQREELDRLRPPIDGNQVMAHLGIGPGPRVGQALAMLLDRRIDDGPYSVEEAFRLLDEWVVQQDRD